MLKAHIYCDESLCARKHFILFKLLKCLRCDQPSGLPARLYPMADASESRSEQGCRAFLGMH
jgi:hypothetical protein